MRFFSWNVNGIRAVQKSGFLNWFERAGADIVSLQEIKAHREQLPPEVQNPLKYHSFFHSARKPGYSGVATFSRREPLGVYEGIGIDEFDCEGRVLTLEFDDFVLVNAYFPNSQRDAARLPFKLRFCAAIRSYCDQWKARGKNVVLCGDYNIAHQAIDLKNPKQNEKNAGFLPEERAWMTEFLARGSGGYVDVFRERVPEGGHYTWWSYRPGVREKNIGWRLDYHCVNPEFVDRVLDVGHQCDVKGSDHCPIYLEIRD